MFIKFKKRKKLFNSCSQGTLGTRKLRFKYIKYSLATDSLPQQPGAEPNLYFTSLNHFLNLC